MEFKVSTKDDVLRERFTYGAELVGKYGFPKLPPIQVDTENLRPVPFNLASKELRPFECLCHFFVDDNKFERLWNNPEKYRQILKNFRYIGGVDFSLYDDMSLALKVWQVYRSRALSWWLSLNGFNVVPVVQWGNADTFNYCFDGLPQHSALIVSTNGCHTTAGKWCYISGYHAMIERLQPAAVLVVGARIETGEEQTETIYLDSYSQQLNRSHGIQGKE